MTCVAVIAHRKKSVGGGLPELKRLLAERGIDSPVWHEVSKSRKAPAAVKQALKGGADLLLIWGGDGTVQRSIDAMSGSDASLGVIPAGTANLLASNAGIPTDLPDALDTALEGRRTALDLGVINGERFAVMAGAGLDSLMMKRADGGLKRRLGKLAYVWTGIGAARAKPVNMVIEVDGVEWFNGKAGCVLFANMGTLTGGLVAFPDARPDDGLLEIGVVCARGPLRWAAVMARLLRGHPERSKLVRTTTGRRIEVKFDRAIPYELDGGARRKTKRLEVSVEPEAMTLAVPGEPYRRPDALTRRPRARRVRRLVRAAVRA